MGFPFLNTGITLACFHIRGNEEALKEKRKSLAITGDIDDNYGIFQHPRTDVVGTRRFGDV